MPFFQYARRTRTEYNEIYEKELKEHLRRVTLPFLVARTLLAAPGLTTRSDRTLPVRGLGIRDRTTFDDASDDALTSTTEGGWHRLGSQCVAQHGGRVWVGRSERSAAGPLPVMDLGHRYQ